MYTPRAFRQDDPVELAALIDAFPLAALVSGGADGLCVTHVPLVLVGEAGGPNLLRGHLARANPHGIEIERLEERWLLSQNRNDAARSGVVRAISAEASR